MRGLSFFRNSIADQNPSHPWERGHLTRMKTVTIAALSGVLKVICHTNLCVDKCLQFELTSLHAIFCGNILTFVSDASETQERATCGLKT
jgi:hypothetical protein